MSCGNHGDWPSETNSRTSAGAWPTGSRRRVLVVDDEPMVGEMIAAMLSPEHDVEVVTAGRIAIDCIIEGARFDAIVCDLMMPGVTGMAVYETLSAIVPDQATRMVFITGGTQRDDAALFLDSVSNARLQKPFDVHGLTMTLGGVLERA